MARVDIYGLSIRTDRTDRKSDIRSVNCISLEVIHGLPIRTDRADRKSDIRSVKNLFTVRSELHLLVGLTIFMAREVIYGLSIRTDRTDRKSDKRSVKNFLRSVNCISLVELRIFSWQERSYMVCRAVRTVRIAKVIYGDYFKLFFTQNSHDVN